MFLKEIMAVFSSDYFDAYNDGAEWFCACRAARDVRNSKKFTSLSYLLGRRRSQTRIIGPWPEQTNLLALKSTEKILLLK